MPHVLQVSNIVPGRRSCHRHLAGRGTIRALMSAALHTWRAGLRALFAGVVVLCLTLGAVYGLRPLVLLDAYAWWCRARADLQTHAITVQDERWVYDERGHGDGTLVLVHGFAGSRTDWYELLPYLPRKGRLVIVDLPGWGESGHRPNHDYRARAQARHLAGFLAAIDARHVHLVGHSMGGKISGIAAAWHAERLDRLTLIAPSGVHFHANDFTRRILAGQNPFNLHDHDDYARLLHVAFERPPALPRHVEDALVEDNRREHAYYDEMLDALRRGEHRFALEPALRRITLPVHVIWCRHDRVLDVSSVDAIRKVLPTARIDVIEAGCGHMPMMEVPATLAPLLLDVRPPTLQSRPAGTPL